MKKAGFFILLYLLSCATYGGVYQWTDENGHVHFGNIPPTVQDEYSLGDEIKSAVKGNIAQPAEPFQPIAEGLDKTEQPAQAETTSVPDIPAPNVVPARKSIPVSVRGDGLKTLITRLRYEAGEIDGPEHDVADKTQKNTGPESQSPSVEKTVVMTPANDLAAESELEISGSDIDVELQGLLKTETAAPVIIKTKNLSPKQNVKVAADELRVVLKNHKNEMQPSVALEVPPLVSAQETEKPEAEDHPVKRYFVEEKTGNIFLDEDIQFSSGQKVEADEAENQSSQKSLAEAENVLHVDMSQVESGQATDSGDNEPRFSEELAPEAVQDVDKCGLFMGFVEQYQIKKSEGCPGPHCDVYKRQLKKFMKKQKRYC